MSFPLTAESYQLQSGADVRDLSVDPSAGAGVAATIGTLGVRNNAGAGEIWFKDGAADTSWTDISAGGGGITNHDMGGVYHTADTLANLNTKVSDNTLIGTDDARLSDSRAPTAHALGGALHTSATLVQLNALVSDATLIDTADARLSDSRTPTAHALGGALHTSATLAELNALVSDATLIDTGDARLSDARTPSAHAASHVGADAIQSATAAQTGLMTTAYAGKLDGIETAADVTDATNVAAAGAALGSSLTAAAVIVGGGGANIAASALSVSSTTLSCTGDLTLEPTGDIVYAADLAPSALGKKVIIDADGDTYLACTADDRLDVFVGASNYIQMTAGIIATTGRIGPTLNNTDDLGLIGTAFKSVFAGTSFSGPRGVKLELGGDGVGSEAEYLISDADDTVSVYAGAGGENTRFSSASTFLYKTATFYGGALFRDNISISFGTSTDAQIRYNTSQTPDSLMLLLSAQSRALLITGPFGDAGFFDFAHGIAASPTIFVHSRSQSTTEWLSMTHNATDGVIDCGAGTLNLGGTANVNFAGASRTASTVTHDAYVSLEIAGASYNFMLGS